MRGLKHKNVAAELLEKLLKDELKVARSATSCRPSLQREAQEDPQRLPQPGHAPVAGGVRQSLLEDPVRRPVDCGCEVPATAIELDDDGEPGRAVARGEGLERGETRRGLDRTAVGGAVLTENADELVDLAQGLAGDFLDRLKRGSRPRRILLLQQACGPGLDEDHVDRVTGRVVKVTGNAHPLFGRCEAALAVGFPLGSQRALHELGQTRAALTNTVADDPGAAPDDRSEEERHDGKLVLADAGGSNVDDEQTDHSGGGQAQPGSRLSRFEGQEKESDGRAEGRPDRVSEPVQNGAGRGGEREHGERRAAPGDEREGGERGEDDAERIEVTSVLSGTAGGEQQRERANTPAAMPASARSSLRFTPRG